jgi:hypothetical protein
MLSFFHGPKNKTTLTCVHQKSQSHLLVLQWPSECAHADRDSNQLPKCYPSSSCKSRAQLLAHLLDPVSIKIRYIVLKKNRMEKIICTVPHLDARECLFIHNPFRRVSLGSSNHWLGAYNHFKPFFWAMDHLEKKQNKLPLTPITPTKFLE